MTGDRVYCDEPYVSVRWESVNRWVVAEWKGWANSAEFKAAHATAPEAIRENRATKWLVDSRDQRVVVEEDQRWLAQTWIPSIVRAGIRRTAIVLPRSAITRLNIEKSQPGGAKRRRGRAVLPNPGRGQGMALRIMNTA